MKTLLKDLPEHKERIEDNYLLSKQIQDIIESYGEFSITAGEDRISETNFAKMNDEIRNSVIDFVNENYEWKGVKA